jgi:hypothetical protein
MSGGYGGGMGLTRGVYYPLKAWSLKDLSLSNQRTFLIWLINFYAFNLSYLKW